MVLSDPGRSLVLTKPSGAVPHKGGVRFSVDSPEYRVLSEWIAAARRRRKTTIRGWRGWRFCRRRRCSRKERSSSSSCVAHFSDGHAEDVTRWAKFTLTNESVAQVDTLGHVQVAGHGEAAIKAWYLSWNVMATVSVAYETPLPADTFTKAERRNFIDELVLAKLENLNLPPSPPAGDGEFLRRAYLDTIGVLPTIAETPGVSGRHLARPPRKAHRRPARRPEFVDYWAYKWSDLLLVSSEKLRTPAMWSYYHWIRNNVAANTPWDELARGS